jgi:hypothetical protein
LYDSIEALEVFPYEMSNAAVGRNSFEGTVFLLVIRSRPFNRYIVDIRYSEVWNFGLKNMGYIVVKDGY